MHNTFHCSTLELLSSPFMGNPNAATLISARHWTACVLLGDVHPSELERLDDLVPRQGLIFQPSNLYPLLHTIYLKIRPRFQSEINYCFNSRAIFRDHHHEQNSVKNL